MITLGEGAAALAGGKGASGAAAIAKGEAQGAKGGAASTTKAQTPTLQPGPFAKEGIPARGSARDFTRAERDAVNAQGVCHTCGSSDPKTKTGDFIPDHQPPNALAKPGEPQRLYPHCKDCARLQGGQVTAEKTRKD